MQDIVPAIFLIIIMTLFAAFFMGPAFILKVFIGLCVFGILIFLNEMMIKHNKNK